MSSWQVTMFATAHEQHEWLVGLMRADRWFVVWLPGQQEPREIDSAEELSSFGFSTEHGDDRMLFVGDRTITDSPRWEISVSGKRSLDFPNSLAVQIVPALTYHDSVLLEGRISIMRKVEYQLRGLPLEPIQALFREVVKSFKITLAQQDAVLSQTLPNGTTKLLRSVLITPGAVEWRRQGKSLKQFPMGAVEFDIVESPRP